MAKRDVELIIRARDQAKSTVKSISDAFDELKSSQDGVARSAERTDGLLGQLGDELRRLNAEVKGLNALGKVEQQLNRATKAVERMEGRYASAAEEAKRLSAETERASASLKELEGNAKSAEQALNGQKKVLADLKKEQRLLDSQVDALKTGYAALYKEFSRAKQPSDQLRNSLREQGNALISAIERQSALSATIKAQTAAVDQNKAAFTSANAAVRAATANQAKIEASARDAAESLEEQAVALGQAKTDYAEIKTVADQAAKSLGDVALSEAEIANAAKQASEDIKRVSDALQRQSGQAGPTVQATDQGGAAQATSAYRTQVEAVRALRQEWAEAQDRVKKLAAQMRAAENPSQALRTEFLLAKDAARTAKAAYTEQDRALVGLRQGMTAARAVAQTFSPIVNQIAEDQRRAAESARLASNGFQVMLQRFLGIDRAALEASQAMSRFNAKTREAAAGVGTWGESTRRALSLGQRLRGEVLSLATAYLGLYNAVGQVGAVVKSFRTLEAATSRLGVVFDQDLGKVNSELQFLEQQAARLGLNFGLLSDEYSKFAVAASSANFSLEDQRRLFLAVAESARVNKVSTENLSGIYLALTQILSKGKVASEELRRQLGDRMAGAFNLFADALGVTTAELDDMLRKGEVVANSDTLLKFADQLEQKFGPQLGAALQTTTTELDRFGNNIFRAQLLIGQGGFIEALTDVVRDLNEQFKTQDAREFFLGIGAFLGNATKLLGVFVDNFDKIIKIAQVGAAIVIGKFLAGLLAGLATTNTLSATTLIRINSMTASFGALAAATRSVALGAFNGALTTMRNLMAAATTQVSLTAVRTRLAAVGLTVMRTAMIGAATAARALWVALGGFPGLILTAATFIISELVASVTTKVPQATLVLEEQRRQLEEVANAYQEAARAGKEFSEQAVLANGVTLAGAEKTLDDLATQYVNARNKLLQDVGRVGDAITVSTDPGTQAELQQIFDLGKAFTDGRISAKSFQEQLNDLYKTFTTGKAKEYAQDLIAASAESRDFERRLGEQAAVARALGSEINSLDSFMQAVGVSMSVVTGELEDQGDKILTLEDNARAYAEALEAILELNPATKQARDIKEQQDAIEKAYQNALKFALTDENRAKLQKARDDALEAVRQTTDEYKKQKKAQEEAAQAEERRLERIQKTSEELQFQLDQLQRSDRERAIASALRGAGLQFGDTSAAGQQIAANAGRIFDADAEAAAQKQLQQARGELQAALGEPISRDQFILNRALEDGIDLTSDLGFEYAKIIGQLYDINAQQEAMRQGQQTLRDQMQGIRDLEQQRAEAARALKEALSEGNQAGAEAARAEIDRLTESLQGAVKQAYALAQLLGDERTITQLGKVNLKLDEQVEKTTTAKQINEELARGAAQAFRSVGNVLGQWIDGTEEFGQGLVAVRDAFRQFAADFLQKIADMIVQQLILNALQSFGVGKGIAGGINGLVGTNHTGGLAGTGPKRMADYSWFANATRYHSGGVVGLQPGEVPAILKKNEEVLTEDDPRHVFNGGGSGAPQQDIKVINTIDPADFISQGLSTPVGERAILNFIRANSSAVSSALGR